MSKLTHGAEQNGRSLRNLFNELNETLFDGVLPRYVLYRTSKTKYNGRHWGDPVLHPYKILIRTGLSVEDERRTMIHEMCHHFGYHGHECAAGTGWAAAMRECHARGQDWIGKMLWRWDVADYHRLHPEALPRNIQDEIAKVLQAAIWLDGRVPAVAKGEDLVRFVFKIWWIDADALGDETIQKLVTFADTLIRICNYHNPVVQAEARKARRWAWLKRIWEAIKHGLRIERLS